MYTFIIFIILLAVYTLCHYRRLDVQISTLSKERTHNMKGVLALLVILAHLTVNFKSIPNFGIFTPFGTVVVGVFFLMSGYGLSYSFDKKGDEYLKGFFKRRLSKLIVPYILVIIAWNIEQLFIYPDRNLPETWLLMLHGNPEGFLPHSWFVIAIIVFYLVYYVSFKYLQNKRLTVIFLFLAAYFCFMRFVVHWGINWYISSYMFFLGFIYYKYEKRIKKCNVFIWLSCTFVMSLAITGACDYTDMIFNGAFSLAFVCGITIFETKNRVLHFLGTISYELYIVQAIPQYALQNVEMPQFLTVMIIVLLDIVLAYGLHRIVTYKRATC